MPTSVAKEGAAEGQKWPQDSRLCTSGTGFAVKTGVGKTGHLGGQFSPPGTLGGGEQISKNTPKMIKMGLEAKNNNASHFKTMCTWVVK